MEFCIRFIFVQAGVMWEIYVLQVSNFRHCSMLSFDGKFVHKFSQILYVMC